MPANWTTTKLADIATILGGGTPSRAEPSYFGGDLPWVTPTDLAPIGKVISLGNVAESLTSAGLQNSSAKLIPAGSVLFSSRASIGKIAVTDRECATNQGFINLTPKVDIVNPWFLAYLLSRYTSDIIQLAGKTTFLEIPRGKFKEFEVAIPPLSEQHRIVDRIKESMERVEEIESLRESSLAERAYLAESLIEAQLASLDGVDVSMADMCEITSRLVDPREAQFQSLLHVGGANIESKTGRLINLKTAAEENLKSGKFAFDESVVLYNKIRPYLMKVARPDFSGLCSADMYPLTPKIDEVTRDFIYYVLMSRRFTDYAISGSNRAGMPKVNREHLFSYRFLLPSLAVQRQICERLDSALEGVYSLSLEMTTAGNESAQLREAILRKAFAGEL
ncbi:restriction endonuclease subunit S [Pseudoxanthomonas mexicana]|uniref:restriction endonuclease subunit S n=1 Tax=Pseudoxanthomonas mexicana TaxID=128785 RepID=UPI0024E22505|nr:restriction endonuclease subunit S [Pseudoxanthomonas mexicana]